jgi:20S proteasome alpha/beta subunit
MGLDIDNTPRLYQTDPSGIFSAWKVRFKEVTDSNLVYVSVIVLLSTYVCGWISSVLQANSIGRGSKTVREFLEKAWTPGMTTEQTLHLAVKSLLEVVQAGGKNIEIAVMEKGCRVKVNKLTPILIMGRRRIPKSNVGPIFRHYGLSSI